MDNVYHLFKSYAEQNPQKKALIRPAFFKDHEITFLHLLQLTDHYAQFFYEEGIRPKEQVAVFIKPSQEFIATTLALFSLGAIPVFMDPGMGLKKVLKNLKSLPLKALIAEPIVYFLLAFYPKLSSLSVRIINGTFLTSLFFKASSLKILKDKKHNPRPPYLGQLSDLSALLFTSGATGPSKAVCYTQEMFLEQIKAIGLFFKISKNDIDYPAFPLFGLFTLCQGATVVIPSINASRPASCRPKKVLKEIKDYKVTMASGSPAIWQKLADYLAENQSQKNVTCYLDKVRAIITFGAPVSLKLHQKLLPFLPQGDIYTPYGATESLPIACTSGREILKKHLALTLKGQGVCIGKPFPHVQIKILPLSFEPSSQKMGEIIVHSKTTSKEYFNLFEINQKAKIIDEEGKLWHRLGDLGFEDEEGNFWFHGRLPHAICHEGKMTTSISCESIFNQHPDIYRSALLNLKDQGMGIAVQLYPKIKLDRQKRAKIKSELQKMAREYPHTQNIKKFYLSKKFPVDVRHNIKIDREKLSQMAQEGKMIWPS